MENVDNMVATAQEETEVKSQPSLPSKELCEKGKRAAARFLERRGYKILDTDWSCSAGEIDIVALEEDSTDSTLCFVEVKTRVGAENGFPHEAITEDKRDRMEKIACQYLLEYDDPEIPVRFDVISLVVLSESRAFLRHHTNAFGFDC